MNYLKNSRMQTSGGDRECEVLDTKTVRKRRRRLIEKEDFLILDDYIHDVDQTLVEYQALRFIEDNAPTRVQKFFPKLIAKKKVAFTKTAYSDKELYNLGFSSRTDLNLKLLQDFPAAEIFTENVLDIERIQSFGKLPLSYQQECWRSSATFKSFAMDFGAKDRDVEYLQKWLKENVQPSYYPKLDFWYTYSNWGINQSSRYPQILDLGYFVMNK